MLEVGATPVGTAHIEPEVFAERFVQGPLGPIPIRQDMAQAAPKPNMALTPENSADLWAVDTRNLFAAGQAGPIPMEAELAGKRGLDIYERMENKDGQIRHALRMKRQALLSVPYEVHPDDERDEDTESDRALAEAQARFIRKTFEELRGSLLGSLDKVLNCFRDGFSVSEKIFRVVEDGEFAGKITLDQIKTHRAKNFQFHADQYGRITGVVQQAALEPVTMDPAKFIIASHNPNADDAVDVYGRSDLEPAWRWHFSSDQAHRYWNVFLEKFAQPTVLLSFDENTRSDDRSTARSVGERIQSGTVVTKPKSAMLELLEAKRNGSADYKEILDFNLKMIIRTILGGGDLATQESSSGTGSYSMAQTHFQAFLIEISSLQRWVEERIFDEQIVAQLIDWNWPQEQRRYPRVRFRALLQDDQKAKADTAKVWIDAGVVDPMEPWLREYLGTPAMDPETQQRIEEDRQARNAGLQAAGAAVGADGEGGPPARQPGSKGDRGQAGKLEKLTRRGGRRIFVARKAGIYERKVDFEEIERKLTAYEIALVEEIAQLIREMTQKYIDQVIRSGVIEDRDPNAVAKMFLPSGLKEDMRRAILDQLFVVFNAGARDVRQEVKRIRAGAKGKPIVDTVRVGPSIEGAKLDQLMKTKAFQIAGVLSEDLLKKANQVLITGLDRGFSNAKVIHNLEETFARFAGDETVLEDGDPLTPARLETIVRTNLNGVYNQGRRDLLLDPDLGGLVKGVMYSAIIDDRTCFAAGTPVRCADGVDRPIESIRPGTFVQSGSGMARRVRGTKIAPASEWRIIGIAGMDSIKATPTHPFWTLRSGGYRWVEAKDLQPGDQIGRGDMRPMRKEDAHLFGRPASEILRARVLERQPEGGLAPAEVSMVPEAIPGSEALCGSDSHKREMLLAAVRRNAQARRDFIRAHTLDMRNLREGVPVSSDRDSQGAQSKALLETMLASARNDDLLDVRETVRDDEIPKGDLLLSPVLHAGDRRDAPGGSRQEGFRGGGYCIRPGGKAGEVQRRLPGSRSDRRGSGRGLLAFEARREGARQTEGVGDPRGGMDAHPRSGSRGHDCSGVPVALSTLRIESIETIYEPGICYDLEVEGDHSYLVGPGLIAHNTEICDHLDGEIFLASDVESIERFTPPMHFNCRSQLVPVTTFEAEENPITPITNAAKAKAEDLIPEGF